MLEVDIFGSGLGDLYYPSNTMDPYLKKNNVSSIPLLFYFCFLCTADGKKWMHIDTHFVPYQEDDEEDDDDDEEIEDKMIMPTDFVIVCAHSEDDIFSLQASIGYHII